MQFQNALQIVAWGWAPNHQPSADHFTLLFFAMNSNTSMYWEPLVSTSMLMVTMKMGTQYKDQDVEFSF